MSERVILAIPFIRSAIPLRVATTQKDINGNPIIIMSPVKNNTRAAIPLQAV